MADHYTLRLAPGVRQRLSEWARRAGIQERTLAQRYVEEGLRHDAHRAVVTTNIKDFRPLAAEWLAQGMVHVGLILLCSTRTRTRSAIAAVTAAIENVLRDHPDGLTGSERWIGPLPNL
jgi:hypothetical protein